MAALGYITHFPEEVKKAINQMMDDRHPITRINTIFAISQYSVKATDNNRGRVVDKGYRYSDDVIDVLLRGMNDPDKRVVYRSVLHFTPSYLPKNASDKKEEFKRNLDRLRTSDHDKTRLFSLIDLARLIGIEELKKEIPDVREQVEIFTTHKDSFVANSANRMLAKIDGKEYPIVLLMEEGAVEKQKARCDDEDDFNACYRYGEYLEYKEDKEGAFAYYKKTCVDMRTIIGCEKLGDRAYESGDKEAARTFYLKASKLHGTKSDVLIKLAKFYEDDKNTSSACHLYLMSCKNGNDNGCEKGKSCPDYEKVLWARKAETTHPHKEASEIYDKAIKAFESSKREEGLSLIKKAHDAHSTFGTLRFATEYENAGEPEKALAILEEGCERVDHLVCVRLGRKYEIRGEWEKARAVYNTACNDNRDSCWQYLSIFEARSGNKELARRYYKAICELSPNRSSYCEKSKEEDISEQLKPLRSGCEAGESNSCLKMGRLYEEQLEFQKALSSYRKACTLDEDSFWCTRYLRLLRDMGRIDEYLKQVDTLCKKDTNFCMQKGFYQEELGDNKKALEIFSKLCREQKLERACTFLANRVKKAYTPKEQKDFFVKECKEFPDPNNCINAAMQFHRAGKTEERDKYFEDVLKMSEEKCSTASIAHCVTEVMMLCVLNRETKAKKKKEVLCLADVRACSKMPECDEMLSELEKFTIY